MKLNRLSILIPLIVSVIGIIVISLVYASQTSITNTYQSNLPLIGLSDNVRYNVTKGHLWFEEFMAGDNSIDPEKDVIKLFKDSRRLLDSTLKSSAGEIDNPELLGAMRTGIREIDDLEVVTRQRWEGRDKASDSTHNSSAGNDLDQLFDGKYEKIMETMTDIYDMVNVEVDKDTSSAHTLGIITLFIMGGIFGAIAFVLYRFQSKNEKDQEAQKIKKIEEDERLRSMTEFANVIGQGEYEKEYAVNTEDSLSVALVTMRDKLKKMSDEDKKRDWVNSGLAKMGDILRSGYEDSSSLYFNIISFISKYLEANQGGLFVIGDNHGEPGIDMVACVAYDRQKFLNKKIAFGEGLVGRCILEKESIYLTEVPQDYIEISSGLGHARPGHVFISPLKINDEVFGVIELASFKRIEKYQQEFIEKISENIASTISNLKVNEKTKALLETSQQMTEELRAQEEEMRQNMEELSATQEDAHRNIEEMSRVRQELQVRESVFGLTTILSEADKYGNILEVNQKLCDVSKYSREELIGKPHNVFRHPSMPKELFELFWKTIKSGNVFKGIILNRAKDGGHYWVDGTIVPVIEDGEIVKYVGARYHIVEDSIAEEMYNMQAKKLGFEKFNGQY